MGKCTQMNSNLRYVSDVMLLIIRRKLRYFVDAVLPTLILYERYYLWLGEIKYSL